jgi:alcohol dehydrogenase class IV
MKNFSFSGPKHVFFGPGETSKLPNILKDLSNDIDGGLILVLTDAGFGKTGIPEKVAAGVKSAGFEALLLDTVPQEPYSEDVDRLAADLREHKIGCIVGIGGGSVLDAAKFLSVLLKWGGDTAGLIEKGARGRGLPCVMVPTTAGTGSESTPNAIVALREKQLKVGVVSPFFMPDYVILDPEMTISLPPHLTASTGVDALCHVLECFTSKKSNPYSDMVALEGIWLIDGSIRTAYKNGADTDARAAMLLGSCYGGLSIAASGTTAVHALSYPLSGKYRIPHGVANAILLVPVMDFNKDAVEDKLVRVAEAIGLRTGADNKQTAAAVIERIRSTIEELKIPSRLADLGIKAGAIPELAESAFQVKRLLNNNPKEMGRKEIEAIYESIG